MRITPIAWGRRLAQQVRTTFQRLRGKPFPGAGASVTAPGTISYADRSSDAPKSAQGSLPVWTVGIYRRSQRVQAMRWVQPAPEKVAATKANKGRIGVQDVQRPLRRR